MIADVYLAQVLHYYTEVTHARTQVAEIAMQIMTTEASTRRRRHQRQHQQEVKKKMRRKRWASRRDHRHEIATDRVHQCTGC